MSPLIVLLRAVVKQEPKVLNLFINQITNTPQINQLPYEKTSDITNSIFKKKKLIATLDHSEHAKYEKRWKKVD